MSTVRPIAPTAPAVEVPHVFVRELLAGDDRLAVRIGRAQHLLSVDDADAVRDHVTAALHGAASAGTPVDVVTGIPIGGALYDLELLDADRLRASIVDSIERIRRRTGAEQLDARGLGIFA